DVASARSVPIFSVPKLSLQVPPTLYRTPYSKGWREPSVYQRQQYAFQRGFSTKGVPQRLGLCQKAGVGRQPLNLLDPSPRSRTTPRPQLPAGLDGSTLCIAV